MCTVTYTDGVENEEIFADKVCVVEQDSATPAFDGNPTRSSYTFMGWAPAVTETVTADVTYTAQWKRVYRPTPSTPTVEIPDDDALGLNTDDHFAYIIGYPDGTVQPNGQITRAEATTIFFRLLTEESRSANLTKTNGYTDVASDAWYNTAVSTMTKAGIVDGYPDGTFRPDAPITRAEMAKIISLFAKLDKSESRFSDIAGHWAEAYIRLAAGNGWTRGLSRRHVRPPAQHHPCRDRHDDQPRARPCPVRGESSALARRDADLARREPGRLVLSCDAGGDQQP